MSDSDDPIDRSESHYSYVQADCVNLLIKCYKEARRAIYLGNEEDESHNKNDNKNRASQPAARSVSVRTTTEVKSKSRCGSRCCICFDPFSIQDVDIYAFFCCHAYHDTCLSDSIISISREREPATRPPRNDLQYYSENGDDNDDDDDTVDDARIRCILCTTAAG